jgi:hypothetical protein
MAYGWNWTWVKSVSETANSSDVVTYNNSVPFSFRQATRGQSNAAEINAAFGGVQQNIRRLWSQWTSYIYPVLNSLPAGAKDVRWGSPLRKEIDCFTYGISGATLFVLNDADATKADGRYWNTTEGRPKTISESFEDIYAIADSSTESTSSSSTAEVEALWFAVGNRYEGGTSDSSSLDSRTTTLESHISQLNTDIYGLSGEGFDSYRLGVPLSYSLVRHLDKLLKIHDVTGGWHNNPDNMGHSSVTSSLTSHTHPSTQVNATTSTDTQNRSVSGTPSLAVDLKRIRWEIDRTRGATDWQSDVKSPWMASGYTSLGDHIGYTGSGTASPTNPHGLRYDNVTGVDTVFDQLFTLSTGATAKVSNPTYTSTNYVTQSDDFVGAISALDNALAGSIGTAFWSSGSGTRSILRTSSNNVATGDYSAAFGRDAFPSVYGEVAQSSGQIAAPSGSGYVDANAQTSVFTLLGATTGLEGTSVELTPDELQVKTATVPNDSVWSLRATFLGRGSQTGGATKIYNKVINLVVANETGENAAIYSGDETIYVDTFTNAPDVDIDVTVAGVIRALVETTSEVAYWTVRVEVVRIDVAAPVDP